MTSVMQDWTHDLTLMQQSVLVTAIRGADGIAKRHISKYVLRWIRRCIMKSALDNGCVIIDPHDQRGGNFTGPLPVDQSFEQVIAEYLKNVDEVPHHFHLHIMHAIEILGYKHPDLVIRNEFNMAYLDFVRDMHLRPESDSELDHRLGDNIDQWQAAGGEILEDREGAIPRTPAFHPDDRRGDGHEAT